MPKFQVTMAEPERLFPAYGHLKNGDVIDAATQPADGVTWSWAAADKDTKPVAADPVTPDSALPPVFADMSQVIEADDAAAPAKPSEPAPPAVPETPPVPEQA